MTTFADSPSTFVWVAKNGNDTKARRGRIDLPYLTIQAALTAALAGDTLLVAPGTYAENLVIPDKDGLAIVGQNTTSTIITAALGPTLSWVPAAGPGALVQSFRTENLTFNNSDPAAGVDTLHVDGSAVVSPNTFLPEWFIVDCMVTKTGGGTGLAANLICIGRVIVSLSNFTGTAVRCKNVGRFGATECSFASFDFNWDRGVGAFPGVGREGYYLANSSFVGGNSVLSGNPIFTLDPSSTIWGTLTATALTSFIAGADAPNITLAGTMGFGIGVTPVPAIGPGTVTVTLPTEAGAAPPSLILAQGKFWGAVTVSKGAGLRNTVNGRQAIFYRTAASAISAGALIDLDLRGSTFTQAALAVVLSGTIDRDKVTIQAASVAPAGTPFVFAIPFPSTVTTQYTPQFTPTAIPATALAVAITARTATGFTATAVGVAVAATGDFVVTRAA